MTASIKNERLRALHILMALFHEKTPLSHSLQSAPDLSPLSKALCFGISRHYVRLEALADCFLKKRPKELDIWLIVLMGMYQLHFLRIPDYAVVKETVALLEKRKRPWAKGLVNAVLRSFCREQEAVLARLADNPAFIHGHPAWFVARLQQDWPEHWQAILTANDTHPPMILRVNSKHTSAPDYLKRLQEAGIEAALHPQAPQGIVLKAPCDVHDLPGFLAGDVSVQDAAAQLAVSLLALQPNLRVLDACCAPGGKTCHILEIQPDLSACIALDIEATRLARVGANLTRLNLQARLVQGDALTPSAWWDGVLFDRILLDAPCSATGVIRRHPDIKLLRQPADITAVAALQQSLLKTLWPLLARGGILVYATCSIMPEENELQIAQFLATQPDAQNVSEAKPWGHATGHGWQILPGNDQMDGFFYSVLRKG